MGEFHRVQHQKQDIQSNSIDAKSKTGAYGDRTQNSGCLEDNDWGKNTREASREEASKYLTS